MTTTKKLERVYNYLNSCENVCVVNAPFLKAIKALTYFDLENKNECLIGINYNAIKSEREELCILAEEKAHYDVGISPTNIYSNSTLDKITRERNEYKAKKRAIENLVPRDKLIKAMKTLDCVYIEALADTFGVTNDFMQDALKIYGYEGI